MIRRVPSFHPRTVLALTLWCLAALGAAHDFIVVRVAAVVDGRTVSVTVVVDQADLLAALGEKRLAFGEIGELERQRDRIAVYLEGGTHLDADGAAVALRYAASLDVAMATDRGAKAPTQCSFLLRGELPAATTRIGVRLDLFGEHPVPLIATMRLQAGSAAATRTVGRGEAVELALPGAEAAPARSEPIATTPPVEDDASDWRDWLREGFRHIIQRGFWRTIVVDHQVPDGLDHILFVLGLYLLAPRLKPLLQQVTAFTVAHSLTLGLSLLGIWSLPSAIVEPLIAASIAAVAIENLVMREVKPSRWLVVFGFGLIHGMGFASALAEAVPPGRVWGPLLMMNLGVECGQLAVIAGAAALTLPFARRAWYRGAIVVPASIAIATAGSWWAVQRTWSALHAG